MPRLLVLAGCFAVLVSASDVARAERFKRHPRVEALPVIVRIDDGKTIVDVRGELSKSGARRAERIARAVYRDVNQRFVGEYRSHAPLPIDLCLFDSERGYREFVAAVYGDADDYSPMGFYVARKRLVVANLARSIGNLRHELVHPLIGDDFPRVPAWLNEGLGSLYGTARPSERKGRGYRFLVNYRLRHFRAARKSGRLPTLETLAKSSAREVRGPASATYYAMARYLLLYLDQRGRLDEFYRAMRTAGPGAAAQLRLLREYVDYESFLAWAKRLRLKRRKRTRRARR